MRQVASDRRQWDERHDRRKTNDAHPCNGTKEARPTSPNFVSLSEQTTPYHRHALSHLRLIRHLDGRWPFTRSAIRGSTSSQVGKEKWREWSYDFRMATSTQKATVFEISNWIVENGEHTFREIMAKDLEGIRNGRFNGMERIDMEMFQHLVHYAEEEAKMAVKAAESADGFVAYGCTPNTPGRP